MSPLVVHLPAELIPPRQQLWWGKPAVANFSLGGLGAGFYIIAAVAAAFGAREAVGIAAWLGPALVAAGFAAVAMEAGRPLRGIWVLRRLRTSWMSRELAIGGGFAALAASDLVIDVPGHRLLAVLAAAGLALAQGFILKQARGIPAWHVSIMPVLFLSSALVSGLGLYLLVEVATGHEPGPGSLGTTLMLLAAAMIVWLLFVTWSWDEQFLCATHSLREGRSAVLAFGAAYAAPFVCAAFALAASAVAVPAAVLAGLLMVAGQIHAKSALVLTAGQLRPITLAHLSLRRRPS